MSQTPSNSQRTQPQQTYTISQSAMNTKRTPTDVNSLYAPSTTSSKASFSSFSSRLAKLPLLSRTKSSSTTSGADSASSSSSRPSTSASSQKKDRKPRDSVKTVPSGKPPATNFADLAYRYGSPSVPSSGRL